MILEIKDHDTIRSVEAISSLGIDVTIRGDREVSWIDDSLLQALFDISEVAYDARDDLLIDVPRMVSEIEWIQFSGGDGKLALIDNLRREFSKNYVKKKNCRDESPERCCSIIS